MNIISFDIEEWYIEKAYKGDRKEKYVQYDAMLARILDVLDENQCKATFFCLGKIASEFPYVVKGIVERGHEIGCHSNEHMWLTKMTPVQLRKDTLAAVKVLEDVSAQKVNTYRAPAFSIGDKNKWALEILVECGIEYDASIFPAIRDFGGFSTFTEKYPCVIESNGFRIKEFPIPVVRILGKESAYSGGGYFRLFPYSFISKQLNKSDYGMCYFHIGDLIPAAKKMMTKEEYEIYFKEPGTYVNRLKRYVKSSIGTGEALEKMQKLISSVEFINMKDAVTKIDWSKTIKL
ncbi:polysaccharide deacetylase family protein [Parabacteroides sp.]